MAYFNLQLPPAGLPQQAPTIPELPPGPSFDRIRGPIEIPFLETWQITLITLLGILITGLLAWKLVQYIRKQKNTHTPVSPREAAIAELESAAALTDDNNERFAVMSSLALRRYFETGKGMNALGKTTDEFLKSPDTLTWLDADARSLLAEFLKLCDRAKFAQLPLAREERRTLTESALKLIEQCETGPIETNSPTTQS